VFNEAGQPDPQFGHVWVVPSEGGKQKDLGSGATPAWSADSKQICCTVFDGAPDAKPGMYIMNADGTGQVQLTENTIGDLTPSWSPDGKKIVFHRRIGGPGQFQLILINADGTGEKQLTFPPGLNAFPNWGEVRVRAAK